MLTGKGNAMGFIEVVRVRKAHFPGMLLAKTLWGDIGNLATAGVAGNIKAGQQASGAPIKKNAPGWLAHKAEKAWGSSTMAAKNKSS